MKYALISEEQIKRIYHALKTGTTVTMGATPNAFALGYLDEALEDIQSLKPSEPVAWMEESVELYVKNRPTEIYNTPLFALDKEQA